MDNSINNVSFGAHLRIPTKLDSIVSKEVANKFARGTKQIKGTMELTQSFDGDFNAYFKRNPLASVTITREFINASERTKASTLVKALKCINLMQKNALETNEQVLEFAGKIGKIVGKNKALQDFRFAWENLASSL